MISFVLVLHLFQAFKSGSLERLKKPLIAVSLPGTQNSLLGKGVVCRDFPFDPQACRLEDDAASQNEVGGDEIKFASKSSEAVGMRSDNHSKNFRKKKQENPYFPSNLG